MAPLSRLRWPVALLLTGTVFASALVACSQDSPAPPRRGAPAQEDVKVLVAFGLERRDAELADLVDRVSDPASKDHLRFPSLAQVRRRFGASDDTVRSARRRLAAVGIRNARLDGSGGVLVAEVTAAQARRALGRRLVVQRSEDRSQVVVPDRDPSVPDALAGPIEEVVGLTRTLQAPLGQSSVPPRGGIAPDPGCDRADLASAAEVADANRYFGLAPLYDAGHDGDGVAIALWATEEFDDAPVRAFETCRNSPTVLPSVTALPLAPPAPPGDEVTLDVIMAGWTAPGATIHVIRMDPFSSPVFPLAATVDASEGPDGVDLLSSSISFCEDALPPAELAVSEHLLLTLAATGVTTLASAGDHGVAGCWPDSNEPAASYPASSPHVVAVGGTRFERRGGKVVGERAWRDRATSTAGGGGESRHFDLPAHQEDAGLTGQHRRYPDLSSLAAVDRIDAVPACDLTSCSWRPLGGTSAPAPTLAGDLAVAISALRSRGGPRRLGWLDPQIAAWATQRRGPLADVVDGSTAVLGNTCCDAGPGFDEATGWGSIVDVACAVDQLAEPRRSRRCRPR